MIYICIYIFMYRPGRLDRGAAVAAAAGGDPPTRRQRAARAGGQLYYTNVISHCIMCVYV